MCSNKIILFPALIVILSAACGSMKEDLLPSGADKRPVVQQGTTGPAAGQLAPDFTVSDTLGNSITLSGVLPAQKSVVLYFTMWCPTCDSHMSHMLNSVIPQFPGVRFFAVDYVSGSVAESRNAELSNGYGGSPFIVLADTTRTILADYQGTMGTTVVIDPSGVIMMNEDYKDGARLEAMLKTLSL